MPVYNGAEYLNDAIESVLSQTLSNFELIILDDRSSDRSVEIIERMASRDNRICWRLNEKNLGLFANYNACMKQARAPLIKLFAQDDLLHPTMLEEVHGVFETKPEVALVSVKRRWIDEFGQDQTKSLEINSASKYFAPNQAVPSDQVLKAALLYLDNFIGEPCTVAFRTKLIGTGFNTMFHQLGDLEYWLRIIDGSQYYFIDKELCQFRTHSASTSRANAKLMLHVIDIMRLVKIYKNQLPLDGKTEDEFLQNVATILGTHIARFAELNLLSLEMISSLEYERGSDIESSHDLTGANQTDGQIIRELAYYALLALGRQAKQTHKQEKLAVKVVELENRLQHVLESSSWRYTAWLRAARQMAGGKSNLQGNEK